MLLGLWATPKEDAGVSSAAMVLGESVQLPGELLNYIEPAHTSRTVGQLRASSCAAMAEEPLAHLALVRFVHVERGRSVPPLLPLYVCPVEILDKQAKSFVLRVDDKSVVVSVDRLKLHTGSWPVVPASPSSSGQACGLPSVQPASP
jgi:hypothetical protein